MPRDVIVSNQASASRSPAVMDARVADAGLRRARLTPVAARNPPSATSNPPHATSQWFATSREGRLTNSQTIQGASARAKTTKSGGIHQGTSMLPASGGGEIGRRHRRPFDGWSVTRARLLQVALDHLGRLRLRLVVRQARGAQGAPPAQEVPALVERDLHALEPGPVGIGRLAGGLALPELVLLRHQLLDRLVDRFVRRHLSLLSRETSV